jgi:putative flippase GtrA
MKIFDLLTSSELRRIFRFLIVGGLATAVDLFVTIIFVSFIGRNNYVLALDYINVSWISSLLTTRFEEFVSVVAFCVAFLVSYYGHSSVTFHKKRSFTVLYRLGLMSVFNLVLRIAIIALLKIMFGWQDYLPIVMAMILVTIISYVCSKYWVFRNAQDK